MVVHWFFCLLLTAPGCGEGWSVPPDSLRPCCSPTVLTILTIRYANVPHTQCAEHALLPPLLLRPQVATIEHLSHGYNGRPLFKDVSLEIGKGERIAIIGPNGAGKAPNALRACAVRCTRQSLCSFMCRVYVCRRPTHKLTAPAVYSAQPSSRNRNVLPLVHVMQASPPFCTK